MNNENIGDLLKAHMGYNEESNTCSNCAYYKSNLSESKCTYNRAYFFNVKPEGICKHWKKIKEEEINKNLSGNIPLTYKYESYPKINIIESTDNADAKEDPDILDILKD